MWTTVFAVALATVVLCACDQPLAPTVRRLRAPDGKATAAITPSGDALAFRWCFNDWYNEGILQCDLLVQTAEGVTTIGSENTGDVDADWHSWSPDGASIAFVQGGAGYGEIAVMHLADGSVTTLTNDAALERVRRPVVERRHWRRELLVAVRRDRHRGRIRHLGVVQAQFDTDGDADGHVRCWAGSQYDAGHQSEMTSTTIRLRT